MITDSELSEIEKRAQAASMGPWISYVEGRDHESGSSFIMVGGGNDRQEDIELFGASDADQDFIAAARQDIPKLIAEIRRLRAMIEH